MKGKDKGIYWVKMLKKDGAFPKGFIRALGDKAYHDKLVKEKKAEAIDPPANVAMLPKQSKIKL